jgi:hypothetical protein
MHVINYSYTVCRHPYVAYKVPTHWEYISGSSVRLSVDQTMMGQCTWLR